MGFLQTEDPLGFVEADCHVALSYGQKNCYGSSIDRRPPIYIFFFGRFPTGLVETEVFFGQTGDLPQKDFLMDRRLSMGLIQTDDIL